MNTTRQHHYSYKHIWNIAYPILISLLMEQLIGMTDTAFLGRVSEVALGASAIGSIFYIVFFMIAFGFSIGAQILIARRNGEGEYQAIGRIVYQSIYFQLALASVLFLLCLWLAPYMLKMILSSDAVCQAASEYLHWRIYGFFFSFLAIVFRAFYIGTTRTKVLTVNSIVMVLCNVLFNYVLIFGAFGLPALGIGGAAIASTVANLSSLLFFIIYTRKAIDLEKYGLNCFPRLKWSILKKILNVSFWTMIQNFLSLSTWLLFFIYMEHLGERALAITNVIRNISGILFMISMSFASTCGSLVSNQIGEGDIKRVPDTILQHLKFAYAFIIPLALIMSIFPNVTLGIYTNIPDLRMAAIPSLWVLCSAYLFTVPSNVYFQSVCGTGNTQKAMWLEIISLFVYTIYITYIVYFKRCNVALAWTSEHVYGLVLFLVCFFYIKRGNWKNHTI